MTNLPPCPICKRQPSSTPHGDLWIVECGWQDNHVVNEVGLTQEDAEANWRKARGESAKPKRCGDCEFFDRYLCHNPNWVFRLLISKHKVTTAKDLACHRFLPRD